MIGNRVPYYREAVFHNYLPLGYSTNVKDNGTQSMG